MRALLLGPFQLATARRWTAVALFFQWFIVITGATVRLTGSGLGCPNWPTCTETRAVPALEQHALIEFLNRVTSTPTLLSAVVAAVVCWRLAGPRRRDLRVATLLTVAGVFIQAALGAMTVILELPPEIVAAHFLVSVGLLATATFAWHATAVDQRLRLVRARSRDVRAAVGSLMLASLLLIIVAGVLTTASGPHSGADGSDVVVARLPVFELAVTLHARGAYAFLAGVLLLSWWRRARRGPVLRDLALVTALVGGQIALGELQYRNGLPWQVVLAHVANAGLLWIVCVRVAVDATFAPVDAVSHLTTSRPRADEHPIGSRT